MNVSSDLNLLNSISHYNEDHREILNKKVRLQT